MKEIMCTHLAKRGSTYYYRRKTPVELVHIFGTEIMKSLGTKNRKEAEVLVRRLGADYDEKFAQALAGATGDDKKPSPTPIPQPQQFKPPAFDAGLGIDEAHIYAGRFLKRIKIGRERAVSDGVFGPYNQYLDLLQTASEEFIRTGVHPLDNPPDPMWKYEAQIRAIKAMRENVDITHVEPEHITSTPAKVIVGSSKSLPLEKLVSKWASERNPRPQSVAKMRRVIKQFEMITGVNNVSYISKLNVVAFKDGLLSEGLTQVNVNQYLTELNTILNYAKSQAIIDSNPASGMSILMRESAKDKRLPFDLAALRSIFSSPVYSDSVRPDAGKGEAAYWLLSCCRF